MAEPSDFSFTLDARLNTAHGRTGTIHTPHGDIQTPAYIPVGTKTTVKAVLPEVVKDLGAQAVLSNAYHLYLQPGPQLLDQHGDRTSTRLNSSHVAISYNFCLLK